MQTKRKRIKRKPGQPSVLYFNKDTEKSLINFIAETCPKTREKIYGEEILPAMQKLVESLIFVYGFNSPLVTTPELIDEGCFFLYNTINKWDSTRGSKAFSYFNVVAKNFLINTSNSHRKKYFKHVYIDDIMGGSNEIVKKQMSEHFEIQSPETTIVDAELIEERMRRIKKVRERLSEDNDLITISAIEKLFQSAEEVELFNKQSIYVYLTEISGLKKRFLSRSVNKIRKIYAQIVVEEAENEGK